MPERLILFDRPSSERIANAVREVEGRPENERGRRTAGGASPSGPVGFVLVGALVQGDRFEGFGQWWNESAQTWEDYPDQECWLRAANGEDLSPGRRYLAQVVGIHSDGRPIWMTFCCG